MAEEAPDLLPVLWGLQAQKDLHRYESRLGNFRALVEQVLQQDPRPAYRKSKAEEKCYGVQLGQANVRFTVSQSEEDSDKLQVCVEGIEF